MFKISRTTKYILAALAMLPAMPSALSAGLSFTAPRGTEQETRQSFESSNNVIYSENNSSGFTYYYELLKNSSDPLVRKMALGECADIAESSDPGFRSEVIDTLILHLVQEEDGLMRAELCKLIGNAGSFYDATFAENINKTVSSSGNDSPGLRESLAFLSASRDMRAVEAVSGVLSSSSSDIIRSLSAHALGNIGGSSAALALENALQQESDADVAEDIIIALGSSAEPSSVMPLDMILRNANVTGLRIASISALCRIGSPQAKKSIEWALGSVNPQVKRAAAQALGISLSN